MSYRVDPSLAIDLRKFGKGEWNECFHCGNCTAVCPLTEQGILFPRKGIRSLQMGLKNKLAGSTEPWLCYYCGECSETCPRDANPGELMMTLRRYLTSVYDWTGLSGKMYRSLKAHMSMVIILFLAIVAAFLIFAKIPVLEDPLNVKLNTFAPVDLIAFLDHLLLATLSFFLITNILNMFYKVIIKDKSVRIPFYLYFREMFRGIFHLVTQWKFSKCDKKKGYWLGHWYIAVSYITMFILIIFYLDWFQTEEIHSVWHPQRWIGYLITGGFLFTTIYFMIGRIRRKQEIFRFSHHSDWIFIALLFLVALTGILIHIFRINGMAMPTYYMYALHLACEVPMVVTFVAFSKWSHIAYRPLAIYFSGLKKTALKNS